MPSDGGKAETFLLSGTRMVLWKEIWRSSICIESLVILCLGVHVKVILANSDVSALDRLDQQSCFKYLTRPKIMR